MDQQTSERIKKDFREWSGGFSPESRDQITVYIDYALEEGIDPIEAKDLLRGWMNADDPDADLYADGSPRPTSFADFMCNLKRHSR